MSLSIQQIWQVLDEVKDPEIPAISLIELGVVREVSCEDDTVFVTIAPTFSGCPAIESMKDEIRQRLSQGGVKHVEVLTSLDPPWSTDWISEKGREKLRAFGISPARKLGNQLPVIAEPATCVRCGSRDTECRNAFGPTQCRAIYWCNQCQQPFEQMKAL